MRAIHPNPGHRSRWTATLLAILLVAAACGDDAAETAAEDASSAGATEMSEGEAMDEMAGDMAEGEHDDGASHGDEDEGDHDHADHDHAEHAMYDPGAWPLAAPDVSLPTTITDASGAEVTIEAADRIGSMSGAASEMLWTLGYGDRVVVIEGTTRYPDELASLPNVGFFRALPAEGILSETPDVLFVPLDAGPPEALDAIADAGVAVVRLPLDTADPASLTATAELIGAALGSPEHALAVSDGVLDAYAATEQAAAVDAPVVAYAVARGQNVFLTGLDSPSNTLISAAGFPTVAGVIELAEAAPLTPEALVVADPAVIVTTRSSVEQAGGEDAFLTLAGIAETTAGTRGALVIWEDDQSIQQWTPRAPQTVEALTRQILAATS
ncbi:MAG: ABC transporter substrate-binding protein [Actinomycetota bacterium]